METLCGWQLLYHQKECCQLLSYYTQFHRPTYLIHYWGGIWPTDHFLRYFGFQQGWHDHHRCISQSNPHRQIIKLDFSSHNDKGRKISTAETLLHRVIKLPGTSQGKNAEINHVTDALRVNNYPSYVISNILKLRYTFRGVLRTSDVARPV